MTVPKTGRSGTLPRLSLAVAAKGWFDAEALCKSLRAQDVALMRSTEVIVAYDGIETIELIERQGFGQLALTGANPFQLWGAAISRSSGDYVAILDANAPPRPGWLTAMFRALESNAVAYHGAVDAGYAPDDPRLIGYLVEYVQFHLPIADDMAEIPGNNLVIRRDVLPGFDELEHAGFTKTGLLGALQGAGRVAAAVVEHRKPFDTRSYIVRRYRHGRCYGADRVAGTGILRRMALAALTPLLPVVRVWRIAVHTQRVPRYRRAFVSFLPIILAAETAWSWGELCGYLGGSGGCERFLD